MNKDLFKKGFKAVKQEEERRKKQAEQRKGKLWRVFFPSNAAANYEIPIRFLTDEPICFYEHTVKEAGKYNNYTCTGNDCSICATGDKPRFVGAFLVIDRTEVEIDERDANGKPTGKKKKVSDRAKLLVRGQKDLAVLDRLNSKYGLLDRDWIITKTGSGTSTTWSFDRGEVDDWSEKEIQAKLPENLRGKDFYDILQEQVVAPEESLDDDEDEAPVASGVQRLDDDEDEEEETPKKISPFTKKPLKKPNK